MIRKQTTKWTYKNGTKIRLCDMSDLHLDRTIAMLRRRVPSDLRDSARSLARIFTGTNFDSADDFWEFLEKLDDDELICHYMPIFDKMLIEKKRRAE